MNYEIGVGGEFAIDPGSAAALGDVGVDAPVGGVTCGNAASVVEEDGADAQSVGHDQRQRHRHLVGSARHLHALLHRPGDAAVVTSASAAASASSVYGFLAVVLVVR